MLRKIISITGKPGLFEIISQGNRMFIVEDIVSKKRFPALQRDKVVSLGDIAMYTTSEDLALGVILDRLYENMKGEKIAVKELMKDGKLRDKFREVVPDFDEDRVYDNDIKKLFTWYNLLIESGRTKFTQDEKPANEETSDEKPKEKESAKEEPKEKKVKKEKKPAEKKAEVKKTETKPKKASAKKKEDK